MQAVSHIYGEALPASTAAPFCEKAQSLLGQYQQWVLWNEALRSQKYVGVASDHRICVTCYTTVTAPTAADSCALCTDFPLELGAFGLSSLVYRLCMLSSCSLSCSRALSVSEMWEI